eukprot:symbB.v1.2.018919.t1/scaffold1517.1/size114154/2
MLSCWKWTTSAIRDGSTNPIAKTWTLHLGRGEHLRPWRNKRRVEGWMDLPSSYGETEKLLVESRRLRAQLILAHPVPQCPFIEIRAFVKQKESRQCQLCWIERMKMRLKLER